jgi:hypothetical protein
MNYLDTNILVGVIVLLFSIVVYFTKKIFDSTDSIAKDVSDMKPKVDILWQDKVAPAHSPRQLNERGSDILANSGIKEIIDEKKDILLDIAKKKSLKNPYDTEQAIHQIMNELPSHCPDIIDKLKNGAFTTGVDIGTVLFVGGIYLRNMIFPELGFSINDLDKPKNE